MNATPVAAMLALCLFASAPAHAGGVRGGAGKPIVTDTHLIYTHGHRPIVIPHKPRAAKLGTSKPRPAKVKSAADYGRLAQRARIVSDVAGASSVGLSTGFVFLSTMGATTGDAPLDSMIGVVTFSVVAISTAINMWMRGKGDDLAGKKIEAAAAATPSI